MSDIERDAPFRVVIDGERRLEDVPVREIASMLDGLASLIARASADILHRPIRPGSGRQEGPIEDAARIRLVSLTSGSISAGVLPAAPKPLPEGGFDHGAETLSEQAFGLVLNVAAGEAEGHGDLARALVEFTDRFVGRDAGAVLRLRDQRPNREREVVVDTERRLEIAKYLGAASATRTATDNVTGRIFEANVEANSAQVRTSTGERVDVEFDAEHATEIKQLLGDRAALRGEITFDPRTQRAKTVHVREILAGDQLGLDFDGVDFWTDRPVAELVAEAGAKPVEDPADLEVRGITAGEWSALYEALGIG